MRIENLEGGLYGFVTGTHYAAHRNNPATPWNDQDAIASCMVLNQNFGPFPGTAHGCDASHRGARVQPFDPVRLRSAHRLRHRRRTSSSEGGATWIEDEVFDTSNDNYGYLWPAFTKPMGKYGEFPYPYWVVFRAMTERFGTGDANGGEAILQVFWEQISQGALDRTSPR